MARSACADCRRPVALCVCASLVPIANQVGVTVVQHPGERAHPFNTARLAVRALQQASLTVAWDGQVEAPPLPPGAAVLFPGADAVPLGEGPPPSHLVVIDGTWPQARALYRDNPWMQALPCVSVRPTRGSTYRIRREPAAHCLSTIEAIELALRACEPDPSALDGLLDPFDALIEGQLDQRRRRAPRPRRVDRRARQRTTQREQLAERWEQVVVLYAETVPARGQLAAGQRAQVLQLAALRPATGDTLDALAQVETPPDAVLLGHMGLDAAQVASAPGFEALAAAWRAFARPDDLYVAWSRAAAQVALDRLGVGAPLVHLKPLYCNLRGPKAGDPGAICRREGLTTARLRVRGRAAERLANAAALADFLRDHPNR